MEIEDCTSRSEEDVSFRLVVGGRWCWGLTVFKEPGDDPTETSGRQDECTRQVNGARTQNRKSQSGERVIIKKMMCRGMMQELCTFENQSPALLGEGCFKCAAAQIVAWKLRAMSGQGENLATITETEVQKSTNARPQPWAAGVHERDPGVLGPFGAAAQR
jgi:hypothetical protein